MHTLQWDRSAAHLDLPSDRSSKAAFCAVVRTNKVMPPILASPVARGCVVLAAVRKPATEAPFDALLKNCNGDGGSKTPIERT